MTDLEKELSKKVAQLEVELAYMREQMALLLKSKYGRSKETLTEENPDQLSLFEEDCETLPDPEPEEFITVQRLKKRKGARKEQLNGLPEEEVHYELLGEKCRCPHCSNKLQDIGKKTIREEPVFVPATLKKVVHIQHSYACKHCEKQGETTIVQAEVPRAVLPHGLASASLVSEVMTLKYDLAVPLYRQEREWKRYGIELSRKTMSNWMIQISERYLKPLAEVLKKCLIKQDVLHADETNYRMTKSSQQKNYLWLFRSAENSETPVVYYEYDDSRSQKVLKRVLPDDYVGYLHTDGYAAYGTLSSVTLIGCLAHVRRKFFESLPPDLEKCVDHPAVVGVRRCDRIFELDRFIREETTDVEVIKQKRSLLIAPLLEEFGSWLNTIVSATKSSLGKAVTYAKNRWKDVKNVLLDGRLALSNNLAERSIKPVVIGRKNYLFSTSREGAQANASIYTIIETAKANRLSIRKYLEYLCSHLPQLDLLNEETLQKFLPWEREVQLQCK